MEQFKIENFKKDNPLLSLDCLSLNKLDSIWAIKQVINTLEVSDNISDTQELFIELTKKLDKETVYKGNISAEILKTILGNHQILNDSLTYIIWDYESSVDQFRAKDVIEKWDYIWYDKSDETIILYFPSKEKIILLTDYGVVKSN